MRVVFDAKAADDIENIFHFIAQSNPAKAREVVDAIVASIERLGAFPEMARAGEAEGTRERVIPRLPYIAVYRIDSDRDELLVIGIFHGAQNRESDRQG